jgi:hypothetical protein
MQLCCTAQPCCVEAERHGGQEHTSRSLNSSGYSAVQNWNHTGVHTEPAVYSRHSARMPVQFLLQALHCQEQHGRVSIMCSQHSNTALSVRRWTIAVNVQLQTAMECQIQLTGRKSLIWLHIVRCRGMCFQRWINPAGRGQTRRPTCWNATQE